MSGDQLDGPFGGYRGGKPAAEVPPPRRQPSGHPMVTLAERYAEVVKERDALVAEVRRLRDERARIAELPGQWYASTADGLGYRRDHWRGADYAEGVDTGVEGCADVLRRTMEGE